MEALGSRLDEAPLRDSGEATADVQDDVRAGVDAVLAALQAELAQEGSVQDPVGDQLAQLHAWAAPEVWDVLEALESADWDSSHMPSMRDDVIPPDSAAVALLTALVKAGEGSPAQETALLKAHAALEQATQERSAALERATREGKAALDKAMADAQALADQAQAEKKAAAEHFESRLKEAQEEGELLLLQLHQVQEELEQLFLQAKEKDANHEKAQAENKAAADQAAQALAAAQAEAKARAAERDDKAKALT
ncbi:MAG: hypothetical protein WCT47_21485, partial [Betaproteobacteria bacterium]